MDTSDATRTPDGPVHYADVRRHRMAAVFTPTAASAGRRSATPSSTASSPSIVTCPDGTWRDGRDERLDLGQSCVLGNASESDRPIVDHEGPRHSHTLGSVSCPHGNESTCFGVGSCFPNGDTAKRLFSCSGPKPAQEAWPVLHAVTSS